MSSKLAIQKPYVVAKLPKPIGLKKGRYVVGEVHGGALTSKKRKRSELAVGVDGEGVNLYDIASSRLITSYALPPQGLFTCPPASLRTRVSKNRFERRTYVSTTSPQPQITLFYESTDSKQPGLFSSETYKITSSTSPVVFLGTIAAAQGSETSTEILDLIVIKENGEIECLDGNTLHRKWISPASAIERDSTTSQEEMSVEFAHLTNAYATGQGIFKDRDDVYAIFSDNSAESMESRVISEDGFNPDVLFLITKSTGSAPARNIHIITLPRKVTGFDNSNRSVRTLVTTLLQTPCKREFANNSTFSLQVSSGTLQQLSNDVVTMYEFSGSIATEVSSIQVDNALSFLRLSSTSVLISSNDVLAVYNPKYQTTITSFANSSDSADEHYSNIKLISYFPKENAAVAISENQLISIQIEGKSRAAGLLIDSIGHATHQSRPIAILEAAFGDEVGVATMGRFHAGSIKLEGSALGPKDVLEKLDSSCISNDPDTYDKYMAVRLVKGSDFDKRWAIFCLGKIFSWESSTDGAEPTLRISFYPENTFGYLLKNGYISTASVESALLSQIKSSNLDSLPRGELVKALFEMDPSVEILRALISQTYLDASELVHAVHILMDNLELFGDNAYTKQELLTNGRAIGEDTVMDDDKGEREVQDLAAQAEDDLALIEFQLGEGSGVRGETLSLALGKLYTCPTDAIVHALQTVFTSQQIVSLIYQLRFDLRGGAWTSKYVDNSDEIDEEAEMSDSSIIIISSLLHNCIDAIGAGGWISGNVRLFNGDAFEAEELVASLKNEISATLEGLEEAIFLKGMLSEVIRYGASVQKALPSDGPLTENQLKRKRSSKPMLVQIDEEERVLPMGLKASEKIALIKVGAGGELLNRSMRDVGRLKSRKVPKYSMERIEVSWG
ncbi:hypothetical protein BJ878DRAFT_442864 [Calycina marina]|uniref:Uncharacterized protein n=1 Tax=Calycina marina TaxID=1763456 RepID=A0A9P7Z160_9HELO|nr:hypothetical protein BJ878DRAFT_442864 [Calycina marina]